MEENEDNTENRLKISNPTRVARILRRICQASLPVIVRTSKERGVAVKGRAAEVHMDGAVPYMRIANISDKGVEHLLNRSRVQVEFIMMSTKVVFISSILSREESSVLIALPTSLVSIERRQNARYSTTEDLQAYLALSLWKPYSDDVTAPPYFVHYSKIGSYITVADLSFGGFCAITRFPAVNSVLRRGLIDDRAKLIFPMQEPLEVGVEIRWFKKIKEHIKSPEGGQTYMRSYRFGVQFINQSDESKVQVRQFLQRLSQAGAI